MKVLYLASAVIALALTASAQSKAEREVLAANLAFDSAIVARDADAYAKILADDFIFTGADGTVSDKKGEIDRVRSGRLTFESGKSDDIRVKLYGNTAVVTGRFTAKGKDNGKDFTFVERYTAVFVKRDGRWQMVAEQATEIR
ncbi:MAG: nuclear transport factor 2 family protein [Pyrinomonadaceae bacterium]|nr:nuclear transport factor 2 family protein [Pyrinomonadaceae bacterium]